MRWGEPAGLRQLSISLPAHRAFPCIRFLVSLFDGANNGHDHQPNLHLDFNSQVRSHRSRLGALVCLCPYKCWIVSLSSTREQPAHAPCPKDDTAPNNTTTDTPCREAHSKGHSKAGRTTRHDNMHRSRSCMIHDPSSVCYTVCPLPLACPGGASANPIPNQRRTRSE